MASRKAKPGISPARKYRVGSIADSGYGSADDPWLTKLLSILCIARTFIRRSHGKIFRKRLGDNLPIKRFRAMMGQAAQSEGALSGLGKIRARHFRQVRNASASRPRSASINRDRVPGSCPLKVPRARASGDWIVSCAQCRPRGPPRRQIVTRSPSRLDQFG